MISEELKRKAKEAKEAIRKTNAESGAYKEEDAGLRASRFEDAMVYRDAAEKRDLERMKAKMAESAKAKELSKQEKIKEESKKLKSMNPSDLKKQMQDEKKEISRLEKGIEDLSIDKHMSSEATAAVGRMSDKERKDAFRASDMNKVFDAMKKSSEEAKALAQKVDHLKNRQAAYAMITQEKSSGASASVKSKADQERGRREDSKKAAGKSRGGV